MEAQIHETPEEWARREFGRCKLGDRRRTERAVEFGAAILRAPGKSLPQQMQSLPALKAVYRLLDEESVSYPALMKPHWEQTRAKLNQSGAVLLIQDLTEVDYSRYPSIEGLGPVGDGLEWEQGYLLSTVLAVEPKPRRVLGIVYQEPFLRVPAPEGETRAQRAKRPKQSDFWMRGVKAIGPCPEGAFWIHVGDRGSDIYTFMVTSREENCHFLLRACQNRKMRTPDGEVDHVISFARQLPAEEECTLQLPAGHKHPARDARVRLAFSPLTLTPNWLNRKQPPIDCWVIRIWEIDPSPEVEEPIDWYLLTSVPTETIDQAWERVEWYRCRWLVEDFHQCLKTGCQVEHRRLQHWDRLSRLLGFLSPVAVHLLALREQARLEPKRPAREAVPADLLRLVAHLAHRPPQALTLSDFWRLVAQQGGYLGRKGDGPPGWKSIWIGWLYLQNLLEGAHLASDLGP